MRYWKFKESNRVIAVSCQMSPRWIEISKEEFEKFREEFPLKVEKDVIISSRL